MNKKDMNIESYDGQDAFYTGTEEEYQEFLKNADIKIDAGEEAKPVENTQKINLNETINIQNVIERFKKTAGDIKDTVVSKVDSLKAKKENGGFFSKQNESDEPEGAKASDSYGDADVRAAAQNNENDGKSIAEMTDRFDDVDSSVHEVSNEIYAISKKINELSEKLNAMEVKDTQRMGDHERNYSDIKRSVNEISANISDIKQAVNSVSKLNDSVFDLKNSQMNTKKVLSDLGTSFLRLKKKCVLGVTVLSILSAIIIALEAILMLS